jgi:hypothetical protein
MASLGSKGLTVLLCFRHKSTLSDAIFEVLSCVNEGSNLLRFFELPTAKYLLTFRQQLLSASSVSRFLLMFDPEDAYLTLL